MKNDLYYIGHGAKWPCNWWCVIQNKRAEKRRTHNTYMSYNNVMRTRAHRDNLIFVRPKFEFKPTHTHTPVYTDAHRKRVPRQDYIKYMYGVYNKRVNHPSSTYTLYMYMRT